jgi:hypothetical protein
MHLEALPESTRALFEKAARLQRLSSFILVGGTALALHDAHRVSEDLDFVSLDRKLDRDSIREAVTALAEGDPPTLITSDIARQEFENDGMDVDDFQQDWLVDGVKVTFFTVDGEQRDAIGSAKLHKAGTMSVLDADGIFALKSMVLLDRKTSRDTFDLWHFVANRGKTVQQISEAMGEAARYHGADARLALIAPDAFKTADPGFMPLSAGAPRDGHELIQRMKGFVDAHRRHLAAETARLIKGPQTAPLQQRDPRDLER